MRDIENRITRYRLSRYAPPTDGTRRRLRWFWIVAMGWLLWAGVLSGHSFFRLWRLRQEQVRTTHDVAQVERDIYSLEKEARDPRAQSERNERMLRRIGMARPGEIIYRESDAARTP